MSNNPTLEKRNFILKEIGKEFSAQLSNKTNNTNIQTVISTINVDCKVTDDKGKNWCKECELLFLSKEVLADVKKNKDLIKEIAKTWCAGSCLCSVKNSKLENIVLFNSDFKVTETDLSVDEVAKNITKTVEEKYNTSLPKNSTIVKDLVTNISASYTATINQMITSYQSIDVKGPVQIKAVNMKIFIDATMVAVIDQCKSKKDDGKCSLDILDNMINEMVQNMKNTIDTGFIEGFKYAFKANLVLLLVGLGFLGLLFIIYIILIVTKSIHSGK